MTEPYELTLVEASGQLQRRALSPLELTRSCLARIESLEPGIGAFETVTAELALEQAGAAQHEWERGDAESPLHGIPFVAKDLFDTAGVRTTASSRQWAERIPDSDSAAVAALRRAGMPLLGKSATQEFAYGALNAAVHNPWDRDRIPGGSSGGSAAAVAARMTVAALGSDTGGSIRTPASICGIVGFKPTFGRVSRAGVASLSWSLDHVGPLARTVADAMLLLEALSGYDPRDPGSVDRPAREVRIGHAGVKGLRVGIPSNYFTVDVAPDAAAGAELAAQALQFEGASLIPIELPYADLHEATEYTILRSEASAYHSRRMRETPELFADEARDQLEIGMGILAIDYIDALRMRSLIQHAWRELMQGVDVVLAPTVPGSAVPASDPHYRWSGRVENAGEAFLRFTIPANLTGLPALSVPSGIDLDRLPIGVQIIGRPFDEATVARAGEAIEQALGPWRQPPEPVTGIT